MAHRRAIRAEQQQRNFAEALLDTGVALNSTLHFDEVLEHILVNVGKVVPHDSANIMLVEDGFTRVIGCQGYAAVELATWISESRFSVDEMFSFRQMMATRKPLVVTDVAAVDGWERPPITRILRAYLGVPIVVGNDVMGFLNLDSYTPGFFSTVHANQVQVFANQAAVAIQNARAYEQAQTLAAIEERQRLARDLHDAVSQTLFSANVIAESLPHLWQQDADEALGYVAKLGRLTKGALAEMRALLLELRPAVLAETDLETLLQHLIRAFEGRTEAEIVLSYQSDDDFLPVDVKITLYRIVQEALNNVVKHASASHIDIRLHRQAATLELSVRDNGQGFDPAADYAGQMGLAIMHERADKIGARLRIQSAPGAGTEIVLVWNSRGAGGQ